MHERDPDLAVVAQRPALVSCRRGACARPRGRVAPAPGCLRPRDDEHGAVALADERLDEELKADRERERLVRLLAAERHELLGPRRAARTSPYVTAPIETSATIGAPSALGIPIASGFVPTSGAPPVRVRRAAPARSR